MYTDTQLWTVTIGDLHFMVTDDIGKALDECHRLISEGNKDVLVRQWQKDDGHFHNVKLGYE